MRLFMKWLAKRRKIRRVKFYRSIYRRARAESKISKLRKMLLSMPGIEQITYRDRFACRLCGDSCEDYHFINVDMVGKYRFSIAHTGRILLSIKWQPLAKYYHSKVLWPHEMLRVAIYKAIQYNMRKAAQTLSDKKI